MTYPQLDRKYKTLGRKFQNKLVSAEGNTQVFASGSVGVLDEYNTESRGLGLEVLEQIGING